MVGLAPHRLAVEAVDQVAVEAVAVDLVAAVEAVDQVAVAGEGRRQSGQRQRMLWWTVEGAAMAEWWAPGVSVWAGWGRRPSATARAPTAFWPACASAGALARDHQWAVPQAEGTGRQQLLPA